MSSTPIEFGDASRTVAANVRRLRKARGLGQDDVSALMGKAGRPMIKTVVSKTERCDRRIDVDDLVALAEVFGVTPAELLGAPRHERARGDGCRGMDMAERLLEAVRDIVDPLPDTDIAARARTARRLMAQLGLELDELTDAAVTG